MMRASTPVASSIAGIDFNIASVRWPEASEDSDRKRAALAWADSVTLISVHHLPDEVYVEAVRVFSEQELVDLNLAVMSINSWNRLSIAFRYEPERE